MIAGGTGITPMLQIIRAIARDPTDKTTVSLVYANVTETDILLRKELDEAVAASDGRLQVYHVLNKPPAGWTGGEGFVSKEIIADKLGAALEADENKLLMCGPPPMLTAMKSVARFLPPCPSRLSLISSSSFSFRSRGRVHLADLGYPAPRLLSKLDDKVFCF